MEFASILESINALGAIAVLLLVAWWFVQGKLYSEKSVERLISAQQESTTKLANEIRDGMRDAVQQGVAAAIHEVRNGSGGSGESQ